MLSDDEDEFVAFHMPRKSLSKEFQGKYRIYFRDGSSEDFAADTVTEALSALDGEKKKTVMKIINLETEYKKTLKNNFLLPTEESVPTQIEPDASAPKNLGFYFFGDLEKEEPEPSNNEPFEAVSLIDVAAITSGEEVLAAPEAAAEQVAPAPEEVMETVAQEAPPPMPEAPAIEEIAPASVAEPIPETPAVETPAPEAPLVETPAPEAPPAPAEQEAARLSPSEVRNLLNDEEG